MGLIVKDNGGSDFAVTPSGMHVARCYMVVELGKQRKIWNEEVKWVHKVRLGFELPKCLMTEGESAGLPFSVSGTYTVSLAQTANLRRDLEGWRNQAFTDDELKGFDLFNVIGAPCMINVSHNESKGNTYANIASIGPVMEGFECPPAVNAPVTFSIEGHTEDSFAALPEWLQKKINLVGETEASPHEVYSQAETHGNQMPGMDNADGIVDDDIPF